MADNMKIRASQGFGHPEPKYYGVETLERVRPLYDEHEVLGTKARDVGARIVDLEAEIKAERAALPAKRAEAMRAGGKPVSEKPIQKLEAEIQAAKESAEDIKRAAALVERDLQSALEDLAPEVIEEVEDKRMAYGAEAHEIRRRLAAVEWEISALDGVRSYVEKPIRGRFTFRPKGGARPAPVVEVYPEIGAGVEESAGDND